MSVPTSEPVLFQVGFLTLNQHGAILASGGDLKNDEGKAEILYRLVSMLQKIDKFLDEGCSRMTINYKDYAYVICLSNKKIYIVKKKLTGDDNDDPYILDTNIPINNSINA